MILFNHLLPLFTFLNNIFQSFCSLIPSLAGSTFGFNAYSILGVQFFLSLLILSLAAELNQSVGNLLCGHDFFLCCHLIMIKVINKYRICIRMISGLIK